MTMKERRRLVLVPRETPLRDIHLENMLALSRAGAVVLPPMLTFYNHPSTVDDMVDHIVSRVLDQFGIASGRARRWQGLPATIGRDHIAINVKDRKGCAHESLHRSA